MLPLFAEDYLTFDMLLQPNEERAFNMFINCQIGSMFIMGSR